VKSIHILAGCDAVEDKLLVNMRRQGQLDENTIDSRIYMQSVIII